jgi:hypothetical protein
VIWSAIALAYLALLYLAWPMPRIAWPADDRFILEQAAALLTGITAAISAFSTVVPGTRRTMLIAPILPCGAWLGTVSERCVHEAAVGSHLLPFLLSHCACLPVTLLAAVPPAVAIMVMLRRGAPMAPHLTTVLGALAAAGLGNFGIRFVHTSDAGVVVLVWHLLAVFLLSLGLAAIGERIINWRHSFATAGLDSAER